jgi:hypothetical protein
MNFLTSQNLPIVLTAIFAVTLIVVAIGLTVILHNLAPTSPVLKDIKTVETDVANAAAKVETVVKTGPLAKLSDKARMVIWLLFGIAAYAASIFIGPSNPVIQTTLYKIGHVTTLAWIGYWIARHSVGRLDATSTIGDKISRALLVGAVIVAGSLGL